MPETYLALLRGVNVGGKNKLPMKDLKDLFVEAGGDNVRTYIQSGNVIFEAPAAVATRLPTQIAAGIESRFGFRSPVVVRTAKQLADVVANNPFLKEGVATNELHVLFLADEPDASRIRSLDPARSPGDEFVVQGREVYLRLPNGVGRSKLTNDYIDTRLATTSTGRNWRTVTTLLEMMTR